jgi:hypothetical protein
MIRQIIFVMILFFVITSCGGAPAPTEAPSATESSTQSFIPESTQTLEPTQISTLLPTPTQVLPTPTDTPLPPLELPTALPNAPAQLAWDGTPTYLGDSQPGYSFRVFYDPEMWALTSDQFGFPALGHRAIPYCVISVTSGRGLPGNVAVEQEILYTDKVTFYIGTAYENGVKKFVTYTGGDGRIVTGFQISFEGQTEECLADAATILTTLQSVPATQATPQP